MKIFIIGLGYVGLKVAEFYLRLGAMISATTTTPSRLKELEARSIQPYLISPSEFSTVSAYLNDQDLILVSLAPKANETYEETYLKTAINLTTLMNQLKVKCPLIYLSSTSVYGDHQGKWVDETSEGIDLTFNSAVLKKTEEVIANVTQHCILRLGEIYGPERELKTKIERFGSKPVPGNGESYVNIIHLEDIVQAVFHAHRHPLVGTYNLVSDDHPTRQELYVALTKKYHLPSVLWDSNTSSFFRGNKRVSNKKIKESGFNFIYPHIVL